MSPLIFAYYCSGHGYGHATRVSAFATHLCRMEQPPTIHIISSAPKHVFAQALSYGAIYRNADIDPVIVQPLAYHVDRRKSVDVLEKFLSQQEEKIEQEAEWLRAEKIDCVLSDAAFLACKAANAVCIPSVLITNFTFDSIYSYLSIEFPKLPSRPSLLSPDTANPNNFDDVLALHDDPISPKELKCLVEELHTGYRCAELLIRLPGNIPIPSFEVYPALPSHHWTDPRKNRFRQEIMSALSRDLSSVELHPSIPYPITSKKRKMTPRKVVQSPLIVRHPSPDVYMPAGRKRVLDYIGVPPDLQSPNTKVLVVSFGGQVFKKPSSRTPSRSHSPTSTHGRHLPVVTSRASSTESNVSHNSPISDGLLSPVSDSARGFVNVRQTIATPSHLWIPGAPPASKTPTPVAPSSSQFMPAPASPDIQRKGPPLIELDNEDVCSSDIISDPDTGSDEYSDHQFHDVDYPPSSDTETDISEPEPQLLPDSSWIAIVCGVAAAKVGSGGAENDEMPENFFIAPRDVYMPDLTAIGDVLLGKLGYGTTSECVDACTPFVYVPRPLFIEEHGLRRLLENEGVGVELSREQYEAGDWATSVEEAWLRGQEKKASKREQGETGERRREGERLAAELVDWVKEWQLAESNNAF